MDRKLLLILKLTGKEMKKLRAQELATPCWMGDWNSYLSLNWEESRRLGANHKTAVECFSRAHRIITFAKIGEMLVHVSVALTHLKGDHETSLSLAKEEFLGLWDAIKKAYNRRYHAVMQSGGDSVMLGEVRKVCHFIPQVENTIARLRDAPTLSEFKTNFFVLDAQIRVQKW